MERTDRWLLPEGIEETLPREAEQLEYYRRKLLDLFHGWGYELVIPPFIEYLESLLIGTSPDLDLQTFKLTDQLNGRLMGVRADMTSQVARIDAHCLNRNVVARLCYIGTVLRTRAEGPGGSRSPLQVGTELYGHAGVDSDIEIIRLMLESLDAVGITDLYLDIGHVGIYSALAKQFGLNTKQEYALFELLQRKACPEIGAYLKTLDLTERHRRVLNELAELNGGAEVLSRAEDLFKTEAPDALEALGYVMHAAERLQSYRPDVELHFDFAELRGYQYQTGIVFAAYIPGQGQEVARGGRYDGIGEIFGRARPATGFSMDLRMLVPVMEKVYERSGNAIFVAAELEVVARSKINELRAGGECVICGLPGDSANAQSMSCTRQLVEKVGGLVIEDIG